MPGGPDGSGLPATMAPQGSRGPVLRVHAFASGMRQFGAVAVASSASTGIDTDTGVAAAIRILAARWALHADLADVRAAKTQQDRWFNVMDAQLRVLDRERQKFVAVVSQSDTFLLVVAPSGEVTWWNHALAARLGLEDQPRTGSITVDDAWGRLGMAAPPYGSHRCPVTRAFRENEISHEEYIHVSGETRRNLYVKFLPIKGPDGKAAEILVIVHDLTDLALLRRSEARYRHLFELNPDAMLMVDPDGDRVVLANAVASKLLGWSSSEILGLSLAGLHEESDWPTARAEYDRVLVGGPPVARECAIVTHDGRHMPANVSAARFDLDGRPVLLLEIRDVSATKLLEAELRHSQKMEAVGRLAGGVAHDFNNILSVILGKAELLAARAGTDPKAQDTIEAIRRSALRGSLLTRQLLAFSRKEVVKREPVDLCEVVRDVDALFASVLGERTALKAEIAGRCGVRADRGQMEQVLMNLIVNARDAMPTGGTITVRVRADEVAPGSTERHGKYAGPSGSVTVLEVQDEGVGMDQATKSRVFEPFFTTKARGEGTGLGLSTVYAIVKEGGGGIEVDTRPGGGTMFRIRFPRVELDEPAPPAEAGSPRASDQAGRRILLVEDQEDVREMTAEALSINGYDVTTAANGEQALALCTGDAADDFELLLTDVVMPGMSGGELAQRVRHFHPGTRVLYISGYNDDAIVRHGVSVSEAEFLQKPFTLDALARKVRDILEP
jgi:PAS domain S-box-containing protein